MRWTDLKAAVEAAGVKDSDDILAIECLIEQGSGKLQLVHQGRFVQLVEQLSPDSELERSENAVS